MADKNKNIFITKDTIKRLAKDVKDIYNNPLEEHGIYYVHNEDDINKVYGLQFHPDSFLTPHGKYLIKKILSR